MIAWLGAGRFCVGGGLELGVIDVCWIAVNVAKELAGGSDVALTPACTGSFLSGDCPFANLPFGGQRLDGQGSQVGHLGHPIQMPVK